MSIQNILWEYNSLHFKLAKHGVNMLGTAGCWQTWIRLCFLTTHKIPGCNSMEQHTPIVLLDATILKHRLLAYAPDEYSTSHLVGLSSSRNKWIIDLITSLSTTAAFWKASKVIWWKFSELKTISPFKPAWFIKTWNNDEKIKCFY